MIKYITTTHYIKKHIRYTTLHQLCQNHSVTTLFFGLSVENKRVTSKRFCHHVLSPIYINIYSIYTNF